MFYRYQTYIKIRLQTEHSLTQTVINKRKLPSTYIFFNNSIPKDNSYRYCQIAHKISYKYRQYVTFTTLIMNLSKFITVAI